MSTRTVELSNIIATNTKVVSDYFTSHGIPTPSFDIDGPTRVGIPATEHELSLAHKEVLSATKELNLLMTGPTGQLMGISANHFMVLEAIYRYKIAQALPIGEERSFEDLSQFIGLNVIDLRRVLRHAMCDHIFCEPTIGRVAHTAASRLLAENKLVQDFVGISVEEKFPASVKTVEALIKFNGAHDPAQTGFSLGHDTDKGLYAEMEAQPIRGKRFAGAMNFYASTIPLQPMIIAFDWASFGQAKVVDVGGGWGPVSIGLANTFPGLIFTIQDLPQVITEGETRLPDHLRDRITFESANILDGQTAHGAEIYFFRAVFHNWPDEFCVRILRNQIPALKRGARIVICDSCLHEPKSLSAPEERRRRSMDLTMLSYFGSRERTVADWGEMLRQADERFHLKSAVLPPGDSNHLLDVEWTG